MKYFVIILPIVILFLISSCVKNCPFDKEDCPGCETDTINERDTTIDEINSKFEVIAGDIISNSTTYFEFDPYITLKGRRIGVDSNYVYSDSIWLDLNNDNINDIYYEYFRSHFQPSCDCDEIDCCMPVDDAACFVKTNSNVEIAAENSNKLPKTFFVGDTIDKRYNWVRIPDKYNFSLVGMRDKWDTDHYNNFMGIRLIQERDTLYCWIRLNTHYTNKIEIYDYVIEK